MTAGRYQVIAFDMDGTLLNSKKEIDAAVIRAMEEAEAAGKAVVIASGRSLSELAPYEKYFGSVRYRIIESGGMLYDMTEHKGLFRHCFDVQTQEAITSVLTWGDNEATLTGMSDGQSYVSRRLLDNLAGYHLLVYRPLYEDDCLHVEDEKAFFESRPGQFEKINIMCTSSEERAMIRRRLEAEKLPVTLADSEETNLECTPLGISKATGIRELCRHLDISADAVIAVGDADNDLEMLDAVGLPVAMGNANDAVKAAAKAVVADNDHGGCAEAINKYLL